jgi:hypothetical protein
MTCSKRSFAFVCVLFALLLSLSAGSLNAAQTAQEQCINICRARYRNCLSLKQIPSSECRGVYLDCKRYTCNAVHG